MSCSAAPPPPGMPNADGCVNSGSTPGLFAEFRKNTGMILMWRREILSGRYCRNCGIGAFRSTTNALREALCLENDEDHALCLDRDR